MTSYTKQSDSNQKYVFILRLPLKTNCSDDEEDSQELDHVCQMELEKKKKLNSKNFGILVWVLNNIYVFWAGNLLKRIFFRSWLILNDITQSYWLFSLWSIEGTNKKLLFQKFIKLILQTTNLYFKNIQNHAALKIVASKSTPPYL